MSNSNPTGPMGFLGTPSVGNTLTARPNSIEDADGINYSTARFQWLRDGEPISGATGQTYVLRAADLNAQISVSYSFTDFRGTQETVTSKPKLVLQQEAGGGSSTPPPTTNAIEAVPTPQNTSPDGPMGILGEAVVGQTLTARPNAIKDADGINYGTAKFQWLRDGELINGATGQTYDVASADIGAKISVAYTYYDNGGSFEVVVSDPRPTVPGTTPTPPPPPPPSVPSVPETPEQPETPTTPVPPVGHVNSGPVGNVVILGFPLENTNLLARTDALYDRDTIVEGSGRFQWLRDGEPIAGATGKIYTVTAEDRGAILSVQYSYTDSHGTVETVVSDPETPVPFPEGMEPETPATGGENPRTSPEENDGGAVTTSQNDVVIVTSAMNRVDGLGGTDTAVLAGDQSNYTVAFGPDGITATDRSSGGLGPVDLINFEFLDFGTEIDMFDGPMNLNLFGGHTGLAEADFEAFVEMYIAYFNRAPDAVGLAFWATAFANGTSLEEIAADFAGQPETLALYPAGASNIKFVSDVYQNVLGRVPDIDGLRFWTDALNNGDTDRGAFILSILNGVQDGSPDRAYLDLKTDLGAYFSVHRGMSNTDDAIQIMALFDGSQESVQTTVDAIDALYTSATSSDGGEFLMPLVGVLDDPFAG